MSIGFLNFRKTPPGFLDFGPDLATQVSLNATLPALQASIQLVYTSGILSLSATLPALQARIYLAAWIDPPRGPAVRVHPAWHRSTECSGEPNKTTWNAGTKSNHPVGVSWNTGSETQHSYFSIALNPIQQSNSWEITWNNATLARHFIGSTSLNPLVTPVAQTSFWNPGQPISHAITAYELFPIITPVSWSSPWHEGQRMGIGPLWTWHIGLPMPQHWTSWWKNGVFAAPGVRYPRPPYSPPIRPRGQLDFRCYTPGFLNFGPTCFGAAGWLVPVKESYQVLNTGSLTRIVDGADIPVSDMTIGLDRDSWCWTLSASLIGKDACDLVPEQTEVEAVINGFHWKFVVDSLSRSRSFGKADGRISGRSLGAWLSDPYEPKKSLLESSAKTAEQLALQELPFGFFLDWQLPTWTVPGNVFQYQNLTPVETLIRLAKSAGGRVHADRILNKFWFAPRWTVLPWHWSTTTPFATLPHSYCMTENREGIPGTEFDAVMVYGGVDGGMVCMATIMGRPGLTIADPANDSLITDIPPGEARAAQELADRWPMKQFAVTLPLQATPEGAGLLEPGLFFDFSEGGDGWRGLVTSVSISAKFGETTQTIQAVSV